MINSINYLSVLCLGGKLPPKRYFEAYSNLPLIAADGAANALFSFGLKPDVIIGDMDSVDPVLLKQSVALIERDQNFSDYEKAMVYLEKEKLLPTLVLGISEGEYDHVLHNINIFMRYKGNLFVAGDIYGVHLEQGHHVLTLPLQTKVSLIGMPSAVISTQGFQWDMKKKALSFPGMQSFANRTCQEAVYIDIISGNILMTTSATL